MSDEDGSNEFANNEFAGDNDARMRILEMIDSGQISAAQGLRLLRSLSGGEELPAVAGQGLAPLDETVRAQVANAGEGQPAAEITGDRGGPGAQTQERAPEVEVIEPDQPGAGALPPDLAKWRRWWTLPLWIGVAVTVAGALLMYWAVQASGVNFWFLCAGVPFLLGVLLLFLAWQSRTARWLHLRIQQKPGDWPERIAISFPIPLRLTAWFLRTFKDRIPNLEGTAVDEVILALEKSATPEHPLYIDVDEGDDGEKVQIYIG